MRIQNIKKFLVPVLIAMGFTLSGCTRLLILPLAMMAQETAGPLGGDQPAQADTGAADTGNVTTTNRDPAPGAAPLTSDQTASFTPPGR